MRALVTLLVLLVALPASADPMGWIAVPREHAEDLRDLELMVEGGTRTTLRAHATAADRAALTARGVPFELLAADLTTLRPATDGERGGASYHTPAEITESLHELAASYPAIARVVDLGRSVQGRELTGLVLTDQPTIREPDEPSWRVLGTHHGDEWSSMEVAWALAWDLAEAYGNDADVTNLLDSSEVWVLPVVNPDGVVAFTRRNANNVDLNRNYAYEWQSQTYAGSAPFSEPESDAVRLLSMQRSFGHSISMHSGATNLGWVWNWSLAPTDDDAVLEAMCTRYLDNNPQPDFWITNGADWYVTYGDTNDWSYGTRGGQDYTLEISLDKAPPEDQLQTFLDWHVPASRQFMIDGATTGVVGRITGPTGGVEATLVSDLAPDSPFFTDPETGAYGRPLDPGSHTLTVSAPGLLPTTLSVVVGTVGTGPILADASLQAAGALSYSATSWSVPADAVGTLALVGAESNALLDAGGAFALHREGLGTHLLPAVQGTAGAEITLDPSVIPDAWDRVNEWSLLALDGGGDVVEQRSLAIAVTTPQADTSVEEIVLGGSGAEVSIELVGDLPDGVTVRFVGPQGQRVLPASETGATTSVDISAWPDGSWDVRLLGGGEIVSLDAALTLNDGVLTTDWQPPGDDDDTTAGDDDDDDSGDDDDDSTIADDDDSTVVDDDDSTEPPPPSGCASCAGDPGSGTLALLFLLTPLVGLRRARTEVSR